MLKLKSLDVVGDPEFHPFENDLRGDINNHSRPSLTNDDGGVLETVPKAGTAEYTI
jgi:hypothetical protein